MSNHFVYIKETDSWQEVQLDESGFAITEERLQQIEEEKQLTAQMVEEVALKEALLQTEVDNCTERQKSVPRPAGNYAYATFDCDKNTWAVPETLPPSHYSSPTRVGQSWIQDENGLWNAPVVPPTENLLHIWNEDSLTWIQVSPTSPYESDEQEWPSWIQREDGKWTAPLPYPSDRKPYAWDEVEQSWHPQEIKEVQQLEG